MVIVDSSTLVAFFDDKDPRHSDVDAVFTGPSAGWIVSPYVVAEVDYLVAGRQGLQAELLALRELNSGAWDLATFGRDDLTEAINVIERYSDQDIGITDASLVVLAKRYGTRTIATLDRRHFEVLRPLDGGRFTIVP